MSKKSGKSLKQKRADKRAKSTQPTHGVEALKENRR